MSLININDSANKDIGIRLNTHITSRNIEKFTAEILKIIDERKIFVNSRSSNFLNTVRRTFSKIKNDNRKLTCNSFQQIAQLLKIDHDTTNNAIEEFWPSTVLNSKVNKNSVQKEGEAGADIEGLERKYHEKLTKAIDDNDKVLFSKTLAQYIKQLRISKTGNIPEELCKKITVNASKGRLPIELFKDIFDQKYLAENTSASTLKENAIKVFFKTQPDQFHDIKNKLETSINKATSQMGEQEFYDKIYQHLNNVDLNKFSSLVIEYCRSEIINKHNLKTHDSYYRLINMRRTGSRELNLNSFMMIANDVKLDKQFVKKAIQTFWLSYEPKNESQEQQNNRILFGLYSKMEMAIDSDDFVLFTSMIPLLCRRLNCFEDIRALSKDLGIEVGRVKHLKKLVNNIGANNINLTLDEFKDLCDCVELAIPLKDRAIEKFWLNDSIINFENLNSTDKYYDRLHYALGKKNLALFGSGLKLLIEKTKSFKYSEIDQNVEKVIFSMHSKNKRLTLHYFKQISKLLNLEKKLESKVIETFWQHGELPLIAEKMQLALDTKSLDGFAKCLLPYVAICCWKNGIDILSTKEKMIFLFLKKVSNGEITLNKDSFLTIANYLKFSKDMTNEALIKFWPGEESEPIRAITDISSNSEAGHASTEVDVSQDGSIQIEIPLQNDSMEESYGDDTMNGKVDERDLVGNDEHITLSNELNLDEFDMDLLLKNFYNTSQAAKSSDTKKKKDHSLTFHEETQRLTDLDLEIILNEFYSPSSK